MSEEAQAPGEQRRFHFVESVPAGFEPWMRLKGPSPTFVVRSLASGAAERHAPLDVLLPGLDDVKHPPAREERTSNDAEAAALHVRMRGAEVWWRPRQAVLQCDPDQVEPLLRAIVEFSFFERELSALESEMERSWGDLESDKRLAFDVSPADLKNDAAVGARMADTFQRRIRFARMEDGLYEPGRTLSPPAQKLGEELRERARLEDRADLLDGRLEVFEHIYEMASQRLGEYRAAHQAHRVEMIIVWLLALEAVLMLFQSFLRGRF